MPVYHFMVGWHETMQPFKRVQVTAIDTVTGQRTTARTDLHGVVRLSVSNESRIVVHTTEPYELLGLTPIGSGPFEHDYLVDPNWATVVSNGHGTEGQEFDAFHGSSYKVYSTLTGAMASAIAAGGDRSILVARKITDSDIDIGGLGSTANITIVGSGQHRVVITANVNEDIFKQGSAGGNSSGGLHFRNIGFSIPSNNRAIYDVNADQEIKKLRFNQCEFDLGSLGYIARQDGIDSLGDLAIEIRGCTGTLKGFYDVAGVLASYAPDQLRVFDCPSLTMSAFWDGGSANASPDRTVIKGGYLSITTSGLTFQEEATEQSFADLYIAFAPASALFATGAAAPNVEDLSFKNIDVRFSSAGGTFGDFGSHGTNKCNGLFLDGIYGYMAEGVGAGGTFITVDTDWENVYRGDVFGKGFTAQYSGPAPSQAFSHVSYVSFGNEPIYGQSYSP